MIDRGLLLSLAAVVVATGVAVRVVPPRTVPAGAFWDAAFPLLAVGGISARVAAVVVDDRRALRTVRDLLIIRGGMHFWAGVTAAAVAAAWSMREVGSGGVIGRLADLAPYGLWAYSAYELTCLARDGCFGPPAAVGLRPLGLPERQFPVGIAVAVVILGLGVLVRRAGSHRPATAVLLGVGGLAGVRSVASIWLPRVSAGPSRQQIESSAVAALVVLVGVGTWVVARRRAPPGRGTTHPGWGRIEP